VNGELHLSVFRLSPLDLYMGEVERFWARSEPYQRLRLSATDHTVAVDQHEQIIDALAAHDRPLTLRMSAVHRRESTYASLRVLDEMGDVRP
jgi:DNA-binding GntR family transcriptional regulator